MVFTRLTPRASVVLEGRGLHSGTPVRIAIHPGDDGIAFRFGTSRWAAIPENVTDTTRCTRLGEISTIEHLMSAFAGLEVTDAEVELSAPELPALDGSGKGFVEALSDAGFDRIGENAFPPLFRRIFAGEDGGPTIAVAKGTGHWRYVFATGDRWPGEQAFERTDVIAVYRDEVAPARTFAFSEEVAQVRAMGLGQGLDETSALVLGEAGYVNAPRFPDEPARHKLLDLMGDLYLAGVPLRALDVVAQRSGHRLNVSAAAMLKRTVSVLS